MTGALADNKFGKGLDFGSNEYHFHQSDALVKEAEKKELQARLELEKTKKEVIELNQELAESNRLREEAVRLEQQQREQVGQLKSSMEILRNTVRSLRMEIDESDLGTFKETAERAVEEFKTYLQAFNLGDFDFDSRAWDGYYIELINSLRSGEATVREVISQIKQDFAYLFEDNYKSNGGMLNSQELQAITNMLTQMSKVLDDVSSKIENFENNGIKAIGGATGGSELGSLPELLNRIEEATGDMSDETKEAYTHVTNLVKAMTELGTVEDSKLFGVIQAFQSIGNIRNVKLDDSAVNNIILIASKLQEISTKTAGGIHFDFQLKKAPVTNMTTLLDSMESGRIANLEKLSKVDLSNFNIPKITKASISNLKELLNTLSESDALSQGGSDNSAEGLNKTGEELSEFKTIVGSLTDAINNLNNAASLLGSIKIQVDMSQLNDAVKSLVEAKKEFEDVEDELGGGGAPKRRKRSRKGGSSKPAKQKKKKRPLGDYGISTSGNEGVGLDRINIQQIEDALVGLEQVNDETRNKLAETLTDLGVKIVDVSASLKSVAGGESLEVAILGKDSNGRTVKYIANINQALNEVDKEVLKVSKHSNEMHKVNLTPDDERLIEVKTKLEDINKINSKIRSQRGSLVGLIDGTEFGEASDKEEVKKQLDEIELKYNDLIKLTEYARKNKAIVTDDDINRINTAQEALKNLIEQTRQFVKEKSNAASSADNQAAMKVVKDANKLIDNSYGKLYNALSNKNDNEEQSAKALNYQEQLKEKYIALRRAMDEVGKKSVIREDDIQNIRTMQSELIALIKEIDNFVYADKRVDKAEKQKNDNLKAAYTLLEQMENGVKKWTAAENGKSSSSYSQIKANIPELKKIIALYDSGAMSSDQFKAGVANLGASFKKASGEIKNAGENTKTFFERIGGLAEKFGIWFGITRIISEGTRAIKGMISRVIELDTAMVELRKVTDETEATYDRFLTNASERAKSVGASLTDVVSATADFARLGYNIEEAEKLADAALVYKNVGDGIQDITESSERIISTMQAFKDEVSPEDVMEIVDKFNAVGNNYAISSKGVGDALLRSAAAMQAANNTLDETIALATAANTITQDPEKVGTTLKTISMFLRAAKTEAEDAGESTDGMASSVSKLRKEILELTGNKVDIQIDKNTFKSTYQILKELAGVWDELSDVSRANILERIGGKRNANVASALLTDFSIAEEALKTSSESAGSAMAENEKWLGSAKSKTEQLETAFQNLSQTVIDSGFIKTVLDFGRESLETLTKLIELFNTLPVLITAVATSLSAIKNVGRNKKFFLIVKMPTVITVLFGYEQFRYYTC